jgi:arylsulfatase A
MCRWLWPVLLVGVVDAAHAADGPPKPRPNIVLIMADDFGYECVRCNGGQSYQTPHLDALAAGGVRFTHAYATPLCTPSRTQIMTGRYNCRNYVRFGEFDFRERTFAHVLKAAGYATGIVGKWQLSGGLRGPHDAGFDDYCLWQMDAATKGSRYADPKVFRNGQLVPELTGKYGPDVFLDHAKGFVSANKGKPFFLYWPAVLTHAPYEPTPDSDDWAAPGKKARGRAERRDRAAEHFPDMVTYLDKVVGRLVAHLGKEGLRDNTLVLVTGDNGTGKGVRSRLNGREVEGAKGTTTTLGTHVALIANWPAGAKAGTVCDDLIDFTDVLPTLAEAAGSKLPAGVMLDGRSFLPQVRGETGSPRETIFCHYEPRHGKNTVKTRYAQDKRWKLYQDGRLYDLAADELEKMPVTARSPESDDARTKLQAALDRIEKDVPFGK